MQSLMLEISKAGHGNESIWAESLLLLLLSYQRERAAHELIDLFVDYKPWAARSPRLFFNVIEIADHQIQDKWLWT